MKIKTPNEFISFNSGVCDIYSINDDEKNYKFRSLAFSNNVLGFKRFYSAKASQVNIDKVITIPKICGIDNYDKVDISGIEYDIELIQEKFDTNPPSLDLTLKKV